MGWEESKGAGGTNAVPMGWVRGLFRLQEGQLSAELGGSPAKGDMLRHGKERAKREA